MRRNNRAFSAWVLFIFCSVLASCDSGHTSQSGEPLSVRTYLTSAEGAKLLEVDPTDEHQPTSDILHLALDTAVSYQSITGFGGAFTEATASTFFKLSPVNQEKILDLYFGDNGARYSLCRTHMNSCDFSLGSYSYTPVPGDTSLEHFSLFEDTADIIPMIRMAQNVSENGFKLIASPWTAPPWMKDNDDWFGGKLRPEYYGTWAQFFSKYAVAMKENGAPIWAFTVENEPLGNDAHWESMHYTPEEMAVFVKNYLGPELNRLDDRPHILVYDQNRDDELIEWLNVLLTDSQVMDQIYGTAVHWYSSTIDWMPDALQYVHDLAPDKPIIHTEACIDADTPRWRKDEWYWSEEATDWGYQWAAPHKKKDHPKYVPVYRYARDIIGCLNNHVEGWVDWNMMLDRQGGPNHVGNWCIAPVIADLQTDEIYITPLYYTLAHFSKFIQPGAKRIQHNLNSEKVMTTALKNPDGSVIVIVFNSNDSPYSLEFELGDGASGVFVPAQSIQTIVIGEVE